jgi:hypothetical protein
MYEETKDVCWRDYWATVARMGEETEQLHTLLTETLCALHEEYIRIFVRLSFRLIQSITFYCSYILEP